MPVALEITGLTSGYSDAMVVRKLNLVVHAGEIVALLGKNGMGKSTLLKTIMGLLPARGGSVAMFGRDVTREPAYRVARRPVTYTPQERALFQDLSVEQNLRLGLADAHGFDAQLARIGAIFPVVPQRLAQRAGTLSGGEQKMLLIARALMAKPQLMLIDEISEGLQPSVIERLAVALKAERQTSGTAMLLVEQNTDFALSIADRYVVLKRGEIVDRGALDAPDVVKRVADFLGV